MGRKVEPPQIGHIVKEWYDGNTRCIICDDYCRDKTPEEVQAILDHIANDIAYPNLYAQEMRRRKAEVEAKAKIKA